MLLFTCLNGHQFPQVIIRDCSIIANVADLLITIRSLCLSSECLPLFLLHLFFLYLQEPVALLNDNLLQEILRQSLVCLAPHCELIGQSIDHCMDFSLSQSDGSRERGCCQLKKLLANKEDLLIQVMRDALGNREKKILKECLEFRK